MPPAPPVITETRLMPGPYIGQSSTMSRAVGKSSPERPDIVRRDDFNGVMLKTIAGALVQVAEAAGSIVGIRHGTEEPAFTVEREFDGIQLRRYGPRIAAEAAIETDEESARNEGFRVLARYIFGANSGRNKIAMTAPVTTGRGASGEWVIRFFMPSKYTFEMLPTPNDDRVNLVPVPAETVAVLRFSGTIAPDTVVARTGQLLKALHRNNIEPTTDPLAWFYDPPWTLPCRRRNEVAVGVAGDP
jgi:SOUL heme-binding protein